MKLPRIRNTTIVVMAVLVAILVLGVALFLPAIQSRARSAELYQCKKNLEYLGVAFKQYHDEHGSFPPVALYDDSGTALVSWRVLLLPYIGQGPLYRKFHLNEPWDSQHNMRLLAEMPKTFKCPFDPDVAPHMTSYLAVVGEQTVFPSRGFVRRNDIKDGPDLTIMVLEIGGSTIPWSKPQELVLNKSLRIQELRSPRNWRARFVLFANGKVRVVTDSLDPAVWRALMTVDGDEPIGDF